MSLITSQSKFNALCKSIRETGIVAFDTEFVAESYYRPRLCLLQFHLPGHSCCVDPFEVRDLTEWWDIMSDDETTIVIHGGREEVRFCYFATQKPPGKLVDVQISEGVLSRGFPLSHTNLVQRVLNERVHGRETRSNWEKRPLVAEQIEYAEDDVRHLLDVWDDQQRRLKKLGRTEWAAAEFQRFINDIIADEERPGYLRLPSIGKLKPRELAVARDLWNWRDQKACALDKPPRFILRDDLLIEMAKRCPKNVRELSMTRGMDRRDYQRLADEIIDVVKQAVSSPESDWPSRLEGPKRASQDDVLSRILGLALANRCSEMGISMSIVGTTADLQDVVRWYVHENQEGPKPKLLQGWRGEFCGQLLAQVLNGEVIIRVVNPHSDDPLGFETSS
ncbi:MAG: HRDC domain-containing protein [Planctomycetaceae bacterium]|nr:HRDC domain-containing protein [Planctomycetaceae bacterium]